MIKIKEGELLKERINIAKGILHSTCTQDGNCRPHLMLITFEVTHAQRLTHVSDNHIVRLEMPRWYQGSDIMSQKSRALGGSLFPSHLKVAQ